MSDSGSLQASALFCNADTCGGGTVHLVDSH